MESYFAKHCIIDKNERVYGYELLHRSSSDNIFPIGISDEEATYSVILNSYYSGSLFSNDNLEYWINFSNETLDDEIIKYLPKNVVVEILESCTPNKVLYEKIKSIKNMGFKVALDDFDITNKEWNNFVSIVDYIKYDIREYSISEITKSSIHAKDLNSKIILLGEKIENLHEFEELKKRGFDLFQGYYFEKPQIVKTNLPFNIKEINFNSNNQILDMMSKA